VPKTVPAVPVEGDKLRFVAKGFRTMRKRLGLAAVDLGKLIEVSGLTIYNWESGKAKPRKMHLPKIAAIREMGKREVQALLEKVGAKKGKK
jgi:DNA-binding XRE family transcriptional regulator